MGAMKAAPLLLILPALAANAAVDVTDSLEYLFAPLESRYGTSTDYQSSRGCHCLEYIDGRIYIGGGDWGSNTGPVPIISILPGATPTWTNEYSAGTEQIEAFKKFSDGRIWTRATDPREHDSNYGSFFAKYPGGDWVPCPLGSIDWNPAHQLNGAELYTHSWDFCEYNGNFYFTGYGVGGSQYWLNGDDTFSHQMGSVTTGQTNGYYRYTVKNNQTGQDYERFLTLMPFTNGCIAVTYHYYVSSNPNLNQCYYWKLDDPPGWQFRRVNCSWDTFLNGYQSVDRELYSSSAGWIHFREATPFKGRVYYIVNPGWSQGYPIGFFSAAMDASGNITSRRHAFDSGNSHPIDIAVVGGSMYVMTVNSSKKHGIWKTTDGQNFTQLATFTSDQYAQSFTYAKGHFYIGYGVLSTTKAGQIWRFALPQADDDGSNDNEVVVPRAPSLSGVWMDSTKITNDQAVAQINLKARGIPVGPVTIHFEVYSDSALTKLVSTGDVTATTQGSKTATVAGLRKKTKYYIRAIATTQGGLSATSSTASFTTTDSDEPERVWDFTNAPWYWGELGVTNAFVQGFTGKGVKVGMVDTGIRPIISGSVTNMAIDVWGGDTSQNAPHGIGVASIIKSDKFGIAPDCTLYAYNGRDFEDDINGIWWCFTNGCRVVNFSGGYTPFDCTTEQLAWATEQIRTMLAQGLILVAAGGNAPNETLSFPQDIDGVFDIAGITRARTSAGLNDNWAKDFAAFGNNVPLYTSATGATGVNSGSSFAAPMATAICTLYLQQNPALTRDELYEILKSTCVKLSDGPSKVWGHGLLQAGAIPANYKTQAQIDAEKASYVKATSATLSNNGLARNETYDRYEIKMHPGETRKLRYTLVPANASDTNLYWYCGNTVDFRPIELDQELIVPSTTAKGKFLVYEARNRERETICRLRIDVVAPGEESDPDGDDPGSDPDPPGPSQNDGWFRVDCVAAVVTAPLDYTPEILGFCSSNAWFELVTRFDACETTPDPDSDSKSVFCLAPDPATGENAWRLYTADGWTNVANAAVAPVGGVSHRIRMEFEAGTANARRVRCLLDGNALAADGAEWFPMTTGGDVSQISIDGDGVISEFFGRFADVLGGDAAETLWEKLGGVAPAVAGYEGAGGAAVPALALDGDTLRASIATTAASVYYTAFTATSLNGPWTASAGSWLSDGGPATFVASILDPATDEPYPALFLILVASDDPFAPGDPL